MNPEFCATWSTVRGYDKLAGYSLRAHRRSALFPHPFSLLVLSFASSPPPLSRTCRPAHTSVASVGAATPRTSLEAKATTTVPRGTVQPCVFFCMAIRSLNLSANAQSGRCFLRPCSFLKGPTEPKDHMTHAVFGAWVVGSFLSFSLFLCVFVFVFPFLLPLPPPLQSS